MRPRHRRAIHHGSERTCVVASHARDLTQLNARALRRCPHSMLRAPRLLCAAVELAPSIRPRCRAGRWQNARRRSNRRWHERWPLQLHALRHLLLERRKLVRHVGHLKLHALCRHVCTLALALSITQVSNLTLRLRTQTHEQTQEPAAQGHGRVRHALVSSVPHAWSSELFAVRAVLFLLIEPHELPLSTALETARRAPIVALVRWLARGHGVRVRVRCVSR